MLLEICANSYESAMNAQKAGAQRIELCSELAIGGITPSYGLLKKVTSDIKIPVHVLIRPRSGDFTYSKSEFEIMKANILLCKELGCAGIVSGVLLQDQTIDAVRTKELIELAKPMNFTFHRAFDWTPDPIEAILELAVLGVNRVLTSGQASSADKGILLLQELQKVAENELIIMPGGGINPSNVYLFKESGFEEIHASATSIRQSINNPKISLNSGNLFNETRIATSNKEKIKQLLERINL
ncbi:Copper homeostasis protein CutC [Kordia antarctica]|uniref:PF03932 family protein CutC n=1 Tax=Kordia antarctica TaxID=1218801 RepID=A0A7L4ZDX4_9FLAO|nr:copper homeostasis protein CutC [Kordia antarctica]QHI34769.1 Copper homeostasis protein CutC [Kordia antarctica]